MKAHTPEFEITEILADPESPPAFLWDEWYAGVGGRTIDIPEVQEYLRKIHSEQYPRFDGEVSAQKMTFASPEEAALAIKAKAVEFGADLVGICTLEPSDMYRGRSVTHEFAIALGRFFPIGSTRGGLSARRILSFAAGRATMCPFGGAGSVARPCTLPASPWICWLD